MSLLRSRFSNNLIINCFLIAAMAIGLVSLLNHMVNRWDLIRRTQIELHHVAREQALMVGESIANGADLLQKLSHDSTLRQTLIDREKEYATAPGEAATTLRQRSLQWSGATPDTALVTGIQNSPITPVLKKNISLYSDYSEIIVTDRHGVLVAATAPVKDYYQGAEAWWKAVWNEGKGNVYISQPFLTDEKAIAIVIARPVYIGEKIVGAIRGIYPLDPLVTTLETTGLDVERVELENSATRTQTPERGSAQGTSQDSAPDLAQIIEQSETPAEEALEEELEAEPAIKREGGIRLYISPHEYLKPGQFADNAPLSHELVVKPPRGPTRFERKQTFVTLQPVYAFSDNTAGGSSEPESPQIAQIIANLNWRILGYETARSALRPLRTADLIAASTAIIVLLLVLIFAVFVAKKVSHPVQVLIDTAEKIQNDNPTAEDLRALDAVVRPKNDIGQLAAVFRDMTHTFIARQESLSHEVASLQSQLESDRQTSRSRAAEQEATGLELAYYEALRRKSAYIRQEISDFQN